MAAYPIQYSGSPIPLRFNEANYRKVVYLLELSEDGMLIRDEEIKIPVFKKLCTVKGNETSILSKARTGDWDGKYISKSN